jgi:hypothetical protein
MVTDPGNVLSMGANHYLIMRKNDVLVLVRERLTSPLLTWSLAFWSGTVVGASKLCSAHTTI